MTTAKTLAESGRREFEIVERGSTYRLNVPGELVSFEIDRLSWHKSELTGELLVRCDLAGTDAVEGVLSVANFNVSSAQTRSTRAKELERQSRDCGINWRALLEEFCQRILTAERSGDPAIELRHADLPDPNRRLVRTFGFELAAMHHGILFGDGGGAKSYLTLYLLGLLAQQGYRVMLADWELDSEDHRERYGRIFGEDMPANLYYTRCDRPLVHDVDRLRRIVRLQGIDYIGCDSIGFACHDAPEKAESALAYFGAVRQLGRIGGLHTAHISKAEGGEQKPFGSTFWHNSARGTWFVKPTETGDGNLSLGVFNRKPVHNNRRQAPFGIGVEFTDIRTEFRHIEIADVPDLAPGLSLNQRVRAFLKAGARSQEELAAEFTDAKPDTLRRTVQREIKYGRLVEFPDASGRHLVGLKRGA